MTSNAACGRMKGQNRFAARRAGSRPLAPAPLCRCISIILNKENGEIKMEKIEQANREALRRILGGEPELIDVCPAGELLPELDEYAIGHAGPPIAWEEMCGPMQGAIMGAAVYEGMADTLEQAAEMAASGKIRFISNHSMHCVGPMTGMITRSMPLWVVRNKTFGNFAYSTFKEGIGKVMRFGANSQEVIDRLRWLQNSLGPAMKKALAQSGPISLKLIISRALAMGDEMHQRNVAASSLLTRELAPYLANAVEDAAERFKILSFLSTNDQFFLNLAMAAGKATMDPVRDIPHCSVVTAMSRNGTNFGIQVSALGDRWFQAPACMPVGLYFPGYTEADANPDLGDSAICETFGIGGFAMASSPAVVRFVGAGNISSAMKYSRDMMEITVGENDAYVMPTMDFTGTGTGIDIRRVIETGILPVINTGMAHKKPGVGQVGAGVVKPPMECFEQALYALAEYEGVTE